MSDVGRRNSHNTIQMLFGLLGVGEIKTKSQCGLSDLTVEIKLHLFLMHLVVIISVLTFCISCH